MPPVSTTPAVTVAKFATGVVDVHLDLRISLQIFRKIPNDPNVIFSGLGGKMIHEKNLKQKIS